MPSPLRSALFTPATRPERFARAAEAGADLLIIDLEDAVAARDKTQARDAALHALTSTDHPIPRALRINGLETSAGLSDLLALLQSDAQPDYILLPKVESAAYLRLLDRQLTEGKKRARLLALIESAQGLQALPEIATATTRLSALMLGAADLIADLGCAPQAPNLLRARLMLVEACAAAGIIAIDSPFFDLHDESGLRQESMLAADMGFSGKAAIHPEQIATIHRAFVPSLDAVEEARAILLESRRGVGQVNGRMVDEATALRARRILAAADCSPSDDGPRPTTD